MAWNIKREQRRCAASGGILAATYQYALEKKSRIFGVQYSVEEGASYIAISSWQDVEKCRTSNAMYFCGNTGSAKISMRQLERYYGRISPRIS